MTKLEITSEILILRTYIYVYDRKIYGKDYLCACYVRVHAINCRFRCVYGRVEISLFNFVKAWSGQCVGLKFRVVSDQNKICPTEAETVRMRKIPGRPNLL